MPTSHGAARESGAPLARAASASRRARRARHSSAPSARACLGETPTERQALSAAPPPWSREFFVFGRVRVHACAPTRAPRGSQRDAARVSTRGPRRASSGDPRRRGAHARTRLTARVRGLPRTCARPEADVRVCARARPAGVSCCSSVRVIIIRMHSCSWRACAACTKTLRVQRL